MTPDDNRLGAVIAVYEKFKHLDKIITSIDPNDTEAETAHRFLAALWIDLKNALGVSDEKAVSS